MLSTVILPKYFNKQNSGDDLTIAVEGSAAIVAAASGGRRRLSEPNDNNFQLTIDVLTQEEASHLHRSQGAVTGVYSAGVVALMTVVALM